MIAIAMTLALVSASAPEAQAAGASEVAAINQVLDGLHQAAARADSEAYFAYYTPDARFIGTDATERWGLDELRAYSQQPFAQGIGWTYYPSNRVVTLADIPCRCLAWFDEELENAKYGTTRGSGVLRLTDEGWKIEQYVLSMAVPNEKAQAVVDLIKQPD